MPLNKPNVRLIGPVMYSEPFWARMRKSIGLIAPSDWPKLTINPRGPRQSSDAMTVFLPTGSYATVTISPWVISRTRSMKFSRVQPMGWSQPWALASSAFSLLPTVPMTVAPSALARWRCCHVKPGLAVTV